MKLLKMLAVVFIPALLAFLIYTLFNSGVLERWRPLTAPTAQELEYLSTVSAGGPFFLQINESEHVGRSELRTCDNSDIEFSFLSNHPAAYEQCAQFITYGVDGFNRYSYIRDVQGNVWLWSYGYTAIGEMGKVFWPIVGLIAGGVAAILLRKKL